MRRSILVPLITILLVAGTIATAVAAPPTSITHYRWKDASGIVHFSDTIPASALARGYDIVDSNGILVRHVQRVLTPTERRAAAAAEAKQAAAEREARQQRLADAQMLAAYPTDKALQQVQQARLKQIEADIDSLQRNLRSQENSLTDLLSHAADLEHADKPIPPYVRKRIAAQRKSVNDERGALVQRRADYAKAQAGFAAKLEHYRALRAKFARDSDPLAQ